MFLLPCTTVSTRAYPLSTRQLDAKVSTLIWDTVNTGRIYTGCCMGNCWPQEFIPKLVEAWSRGDFPFTDLIKMYSAKEMGAAARDVEEGRVIKAVLTW